VLTAPQVFRIVKLSVVRAEEQWAASPSV
jgi:hypothetical protein